MSISRGTGTGTGTGNRQESADHATFGAHQISRAEEEAGKKMILP